MEEKITEHNSTYPKVAIQWLAEALCFVSSAELAESFVLRKCQLLVAANRSLEKSLPGIFQQPLLKKIP